MRLSFHIAILFMLVIAGCMPSASAVQTATAQTQIAIPTATASMDSQPMSVTPSQTLEPSATPTETTLPTATPLPLEITDAKEVSMILVPEGEFEMGDDFNPSEQFVHNVHLDAFYMDVYEVTNALYRLCVDAGDCTPLQKGISNRQSK